MIDKIGIELTWLAMLLFTHFAVVRLKFLSDRMRIVLNDLLFTLVVATVTLACLKLIGFAAERYEANLSSKNEPDTSDKRDPVILTVERLADLLVLIVAISVGLSYFGVGISAMAAMVLVIGLVITYGARDIIADAISGFIILADRPFRIGDGILLKDPDLWGRVLEIGACTTRILTVDNREVIVPNSSIARSQIVNYSFPDTSYQVKSEIRIAYDTDVDQVRKIITDALRAIDGVLPDKPVDVFFLEFLESARRVRVSWWIDNYVNEFMILDLGNAAIERSLHDAGIRMPLQTYDLNIRQETGVSEPAGPANSQAETNS